MNKQTAQKAAKWWTDFLRTDVTPDNGDHSPSGAWTSALASILQEKEKAKQSVETINSFEKELTKLLIEETGKYIYINVDYHPDYILQEAADRAHLPLGMTTLPWKTSMWINDDKITVAAGYQAERVEI